MGGILCPKSKECPCQKRRPYSTFSYKDGINFVISIIGNQKIGKTSFLKRYATGVYKDNDLRIEDGSFYNKKTIHKNLELEIVFKDTEVKHYEKLKYFYFNANDCVIFCFDVNDRKSYDDIKQWKQKCFINLDCLYVIVGLKVDVGNRCVSYEEGLNMQRLIAADAYFEVSSKMDNGVKEAFDEILNLLLLKRGN